MPRAHSYSLGMRVGVVGREVGNGLQRMRGFPNCSKSSGSLVRAARTRPHPWQTARHKIIQVKVREQEGPASPRLVVGYWASKLQENYRLQRPSRFLLALLMPSSSQTCLQPLKKIIIYLFIFVCLLLVGLPHEIPQYNIYIHVFF